VPGTGTRFGNGRLILIVAVAAVVLVGGIFAVNLYEALRDENVWTDRDGQSVPESKVVSYFGPEHCDWQDVVFLQIGYRSGLTQPGLSGELKFLRDPAGELADHTVARFEPSAELPANAVDTGWQRDGQELWLDPDGAALSADRRRRFREVALDPWRHRLRLI